MSREPTFLGTSPSGLRQTAIRSLLLLGADGLELAAHTRLQLDGVQEYQFAFGQQLDSEGQVGGNGVDSGEVQWRPISGGTLSRLARLAIWNGRPSPCSWPRHFRDRTP